MALIRCPECGKDISDQSEVCIHCGYPVAENQIPEYDPNTVCPVCKSVNWVYDEIRGLVNCDTCGYCIAKNEIIAKKYRAIRMASHHESNDTPSTPTLRCPRCGSVNVTTGSRGYSILTGFLGSGKTVNRCGSCGHKWKP